MKVVDLGLMEYGAAHAEQQRAHGEVLAGGDERILLVEHPPVITMGRRGETLGVKNLLASPEVLASRGVEFVQTDRGGDITFHGPGQLIAYPIIRIADHQLTVGSYVRTLLSAVIDTLKQFGIDAATDESGIGVWVNGAKICALGVRIKRGVSMHGIALNVTTDLSYFDLVVPCGLVGKSMTSMQKILADRTPPIEQVKSALVACITARVCAADKRR